MRNEQAVHEQQNVKKNNDRRRECVNTPLLQDALNPVSVAHFLTISFRAFIIANGDSS